MEHCSSQCPLAFRLMFDQEIIHTVFTRINAAPRLVAALELWPQLQLDETNSSSGVYSSKYGKYMELCLFNIELYMCIHAASKLKCQLMLHPIHKRKQ